MRFIRAGCLAGWQQFFFFPRIHSAHWIFHLCNIFAIMKSATLAENGLCFLVPFTHSLFHVKGIRFAFYFGSETFT